MYKKILLLSLMVLAILACQGGGGYRDMAMITDAERSLRGVRNALEEYWVDNETYPEEEADLETVLRPYFLRVRFKENDDAAIHSANIENARNQLENITSLLANVKRQAIPQLDSSMGEKLLSHMERVQDLISQYELEIEATEMPALDINTKNEFKAMLDILKGVNPDSIVSEIDNKLIGKGGEIIHSMEELKDKISKLPLDSARITDVVNKSDAISKTFKVYEAYLIHKPISEAEVVVPEREFQNIEVILDTLALDSSLIFVMENIRQGINQYRSLEIHKSDMTSMFNAIEALERAMAILLKYENTARKDVQKTAIILKASVALHKMMEAIEDYRKENGDYPPEGIDVEPILHSRFIEITMGGDTIDRYEKNLSYLNEFPSYSVIDSKSSELRARVANDAKTSIFCRVEIVSDWNKVISAFVQGPIYRTVDPKVTCFLTAKAKDRRNTLICERSSVRTETKGKEKKSKKKE